MLGKRWEAYSALMPGLPDRSCIHLSSWAYQVRATWGSTWLWAMRMGHAGGGCRWCEPEGADVFLDPSLFGAS